MTDKLIVLVSSSHFTIDTFYSSFLEYGGERNCEGSNVAPFNALRTLSLVESSPVPIVFNYLIEQSEDYLILHLSWNKRGENVVGRVVITECSVAISV